MTADHTPERLDSDVEALADTLRWSPGWSGALPDAQRPRASARYILASDWLAAYLTAHLADVEARLAAAESLIPLYESHANVSQFAKVYRNIARDLRAALNGGAE